MLPPVTGASPSTARPRVDFPEPDSPTRPTVSPGRMSMETPFRARKGAPADALGGVFDDEVVDDEQGLGHG